MSKFHQADRSTYVMSDEEFAAMGGTYLDGTEGTGPWSTGVKAFGHVLHLHSGPIGVDAAADIWPTVQSIAETHGVEPLSIQWPNIHAPEFSAVAVGA